MKAFPHFLLSIFILLELADGLLAERLDSQSSFGLPADLVDANGEARSTNFKDKFIGLYFSASWCGPFRQFTPQLVSFRNNSVYIHL